MDNKVNLYNKKILITGGLGFIGSNLTSRLLPGNNEITILNRHGKSYWLLCEV